MYSPVDSLTDGSGFYFLGANPREAPDQSHLHSVMTVDQDLQRIEKGESIEHAYLDETWKHYPPGKAKLQVHGQQLFAILAGGSIEAGIELLRRTPTSNFILRRSVDQKSLEIQTGQTLAQLAKAYWPFHQQVIHETKCRALITHAVEVARVLAKAMNWGEPEIRPSGWGGTLCNCYIWRIPRGPVLIALPNLSRYSPDGIRQEALSKIFEEFLPR
ncbi:MAG TPA: hypothetical protein PK208_00460 [Fibrobacteria bacterium]|nr:hypothetical protein [Fibrobacteria bacterium]